MKSISSLPTITKAELQAFPSYYKEHIIIVQVEQITDSISRTAKNGNTQYLYVINEEFIEARREMAPYDYIPTILELLTMLKRVYPDSKITRIKEGILIDWA